MRIEFSQEYLSDLYQGDARKYKEYKSNPQLIKQYVKAINKLKALTRREQLYQIKSFNYEKKEGDLKGISAIWINKKYRILFKEISSDPNNLVIDLLRIEELTNHYRK